MVRKISDLKIVLGSGSPRRKQLLSEAGFHFVVRTKEIDETPPAGLARNQIAEKLAQMKAEALQASLSSDEILITADTIVCLGDQVLNKPSDVEHAFKMLKALNGKTHQVYTGVCISKKEKSTVFSVKTDVEFNDLSDEAIKTYISICKPFDKAGSYGAQESLPAGINPCSTEELEFMASIGKPDIFKNTLTPGHAMNSPLIKKINGSYFNVMGLPIRELTLALLNE